MNKKIKHDDTWTEANRYLYQIYNINDPHISRDIDKKYQAVNKLF